MVVNSEAIKYRPIVIIIIIIAMIVNIVVAVVTVAWLSYGTVGSSEISCMPHDSESV